MHSREWRAKDTAAARTKPRSSTKEPHAAESIRTEAGRRGTSPWLLDSLVSVSSEDIAAGFLALGVTKQGHVRIAHIRPLRDICGSWEVEDFLHQHSCYIAHGTGRVSVLELMARF